MQTNLWIEIAQWTLAAVLGLFFVACALTNLAILVQGVLGKLTRPTSLILVVGGVSGVVATLVAPVPLFRWWWLPLLIDPGCSMFLTCPFYYVRDCWKKS